MNNTTAIARNKYFGALLSDTAKSYYEKGITYFSNDEKMIKCYQMDFAALTAIAEMISNFDNTEEGRKIISQKIWRLDTAVRDIIPEEVYNYFMRKTSIDIIR